MTDSTLSERQRSRLAYAFQKAEASGLRLATTGRLGALAIIAVWLGLTGRFPADLFYHAVVGVFALLGLAQLWVSRRDPRWRWLLYLLVLADAALMAAVLATSNPFGDEAVAPGVQFHFPRFAYFFLLPVFTVLSFSPALVLWSGFAVCLAWGGFLAAALRAPLTLTVADYNGPVPASPEVALAFMANPQFVDVQARVEEMMVLMIVSGLLALAVRRMRLLVRDQAMTERARANLARYFSPRMVDELAAVDRPFAEVRTQTVAVLFADIVGFTAQCETMKPAEAIAMLREFHRRMEQAVYEFGGSLDKYLGDGVMATFGTPRPGPHDASNALACARSMLDRVDAWNAERRGAGLGQVRIGIGAHCGPVVLGDVGSDRHIEFAVIGDAVNVASRLEALTRDLNVDIVISDTLAGHAEAQGGAVFLVGFEPAMTQVLRGRADKVMVRSFRQPCAAPR